MLEIASGTGEHAIHFAAGLPHLLWQPSDRDPEAVGSIAAHRDSAGLPNLLAPILLDASAPTWPVEWVDAMVAVNMIHIAPWSAALGLMAGAGRVLGPGGVLFLYGPYREEGRPTAPSNEAFDQSLKARNPEWGLRRREDLVELASRHGLALLRRVEMPANNISLAFRRGS